VERANAKVLKGLKTRTYDGLKNHGKKWIDELPCALWGNRTSPSHSTGETPFFMVYGAEAVLPPEVTMGSLRVKTYDEATQCHTPFRERGNEASIRVPRMFKSHAWQQYD
jgi:hypothetical protein